jgi:hypothetical protein
MSFVRALVAVAAAGTVFVAAAPVANAAATIPLAVWEMNEPRGAQVMVDSSGNGRHGDIGDEVVTGWVIDGATAYHFPWLKPNTPPAHPEHLVIVPDSANIDPGTRDYAITMRVRWTHKFGNMIQKGQSNTAGGQFKWQAPNGVVQCLFKGSSGRRGVGSGRALNDGVWHVIRCERTANAVTMTVDGVVVSRNLGPTGNINNTRPLSIAGKTNCDQITITCDYFPGDIDWIRIETS